MRDDSEDPQAGRNLVIAAGAAGLLAVMVYGASITRTQAHVDAGVKHAAATIPLATLAAELTTARAQLDVTALDRLTQQLEQSIASTTLESKAAAARIELIEAWAARALEAAIRAQIDERDRVAAERAASSAIAQARNIARLNSRNTLDPGRLEAALARLELASGTDITETYPIVLLPTYRDPELHQAALAAPLWRAGNEPIDPELVSEIVDQLREVEQPTVLIRLLGALAAVRAGDREHARAVADRVLAEVPGQPLAMSVLTMLGPGDMIAAVDATAPHAPTTAAPPPSAPQPPAPVDNDAPGRPTPPSQRDAAPTPAVEPSPATSGDGTKPKAPLATRDPRDKKGYEALLAEGCKLVRSGEAQRGFDLLKEAFDLNPNAVAVTVCMAEAHHQLGRDASARALCERALKRAPSDRRALLLAAELELARGNESTALDHYRKILQTHPDDAKAKAFVESRGG